MSAPDPDPARQPLLFPDPVVEFYMEKVDRAAIRERLRMTTEERLEALVQQQEAATAEAPARVREEPTPHEPAPPMQFAGSEYVPSPDPAKRPLLFPDLVVEAYLKDVDRSLIREQLKLTTAQRLECLESMAEFYEAGRRLRAEEKRQRQEGRTGS